MLKNNVEFFESLYYLKMSELKKVCDFLQIPSTGAKGQRIERIKHFINTGTILAVQEIPTVSKAKKHETYSLKPEALILQGAYKNDAKTRAFFKKLIGNHFHFTAFGIDWLNERWMKGKPPTYKEFARMWQQEVDKRKQEKPQPKKEWAYITFVQNYMKKHPNASKLAVTKAWNELREEKVAFVFKFF